MAASLGEVLTSIKAVPLSGTGSMSDHIQAENHLCM